MAKTAFWFAMMTLAVVGSFAIPVPENERPEDAVKQEMVNADASKAQGEQAVQTTVQDGASAVAAAKPDVQTIEPARRPAKPEKQYVQSVQVGSHIPFFMELFQPPVSWVASPEHANNQGSYPVRKDPFGGADPFDAFTDPTKSGSFNQMIEAYTNEFRTPDMIIIKSKRNVEPNNNESLLIPPIPMLLNIMLNAFQHDPTDMLAAFEKSMLEMDNLDKADKVVVAELPLNKTTSKTEIINGHVVQVNETMYSNGDGNHQSFFHFKKVHVVPEAVVKNSANEKVISISKADSETKKLETNEIKDVVPSKTDIDNNNPNYSKKRQTAEPVALDDHFQTAAASYWPYGGRYYSVRPVALYAQPAAAVAISHHQHHHGAAQLAVDYQQHHGMPPPLMVDQYGRPLPPQPFFGHGYPGNGPTHHGYGPATTAVVGGHHGNVPQPTAGHYGNAPQPTAGYHGKPLRPDQHAKPISLHGDTYVNELAAAQQQASGHNTLPADVEIVDVNGRPQATGGKFYYNKNHYGDNQVPRAQASKH